MLIQRQLDRRSLAQLSTNGTWHSEAGVHVREEAGRVLLNLPDLETRTCVLAVRDDTSLEWSHHAADADSLLSISDWDRVRDCKARWPSLTAWRLVDVSGRVGRRLVLAAEALELNVPADVVLPAVDAVVVVTDSAL